MISIGGMFPFKFCYLCDQQNIPGSANSGVGVDMPGGGGGSRTFKDGMLLLELEVRPNPF